MKTTIPIDVISLGEEDSYHLFVSAAVNGEQYSLLIDTGASQTIFDAAVISELPVGEIKKRKIHSTGINVGELNVRFGRIDNFQLGDLKRAKWVVALLNLAHLNEMYGNFTDKVVAGLIGSDFMLQYKAVIDYRKKELVLRDIRKNDFR
jgi:predicted aspartyl protease